jgi:hypothetical protein
VRKVSWPVTLGEVGALHGTSALWERGQTTLSPRRSGLRSKAQVHLEWPKTP